MVNKVKENMDELKALSEKRSKLEKLLEKKEAIIEKLFEGGKKEKELTTKEEDIYQAIILDIFYLKEALMSNSRKSNFIIRISNEY